MYNNPNTKSTQDSKTGKNGQASNDITKLLDEAILRIKKEPLIDNFMQRKLAMKLATTKKDEMRLSKQKKLDFAEKQISSIENVMAQKQRRLLKSLTKKLRGLKVIINSNL